MSAGKDQLSTELSEKEKENVKLFLKRNREIKACANCGGLDLTIPNASLFAPKGLESVMGGYLCRECGHEGTPIVFDDGRSYERFFSLRREKYNKGEDQLTSSNPISRSPRKDKD